MADPDRLELVVVAIPSDDDRVRKISSEKVPHITLLYLGSPEWDGNQLAEVASYVQHAAANFHSFGMSVDRRGVLGEKQADVLFFNKSWSFKDLEKFRRQLRANQDIDKAYLSTTQFPSWIPHLTLGFPETPAHDEKDDRDYPISWVNFDKIALWVGDSEGPTFQLKEDRGLEVAMSVGSDAVDEILHYGVKGMKWGKRKKRQTDPDSEDTVRVTNLKVGVKTQKTTRHLSNTELEDAIKRMRLEQEFSKLSGGLEKTRVQKGRALIAKLLSDQGKQTANQALGNVSRTGLDAAFKKAAAAK
jgi:2'-5' RNA ligase